MDLDSISIEYTEDQISQMSDKEMLKLLIKLGFSNRNLLQKHDKILFGNGEQGICESVRDVCKSAGHLWKFSVWLTGLLLTVTGAGVTWIFYHLDHHWLLIKQVLK